MALGPPPWVRAPIQGAGHIPGSRPNIWVDPAAFTWQPGPPPEKDYSMLETLIKMYTACMLQDVRSPTPHLAGPPGVGKSSVVEELASLVGKKLHVVNVARLSPLEIEGVQMPVDGNTRLHLLLSTMWSQLEEGDIVLFDEFMRGFPEVYNGLLDIMTSREVAGHKLPKVFFVAASNSVAAYDEALRDRLLHVFVPDLRVKRAARVEVAGRLVDALGLMPKMQHAPEMEDLLQQEVVPMYDVLDQFSGKASPGTAAKKGTSVRNLIGQAKLRHVTSDALTRLIHANNRSAMREDKPQFVLYLGDNELDSRYQMLAEQLMKNRTKLTPIQAANVQMNLHLIQMKEASTEVFEEGDTQDDDIF